MQLRLSGARHFPQARAIKSCRRGGSGGLSIDIAAKDHGGGDVLDRFVAGHGIPDSVQVINGA
ncbi:hypothetical protein PproGo58_22740 [Pseudomonas protegens]|nr:hypothetical protein PproGo58_22740 [Pseudomonas protegens]